MITLFVRSMVAACLVAGMPALATQTQAEPLAAAGSSSAPAGAAAVVDRFHSALRGGDLAAAAALLDDNALIFESGGVERSKAEYAAHHLPADAAFSKAVPGAITARVGGGAGDLAWVATESRMAGSFKGSEVERVSTETMLLRRTTGGA